MSFPCFTTVAIGHLAWWSRNCGRRFFPSSPYFKRIVKLLLTKIVQVYSYLSLSSVFTTRKANITLFMRLYYYTSPIIEEKYIALFKKYELSQIADEIWVTDQNLLQLFVGSNIIPDYYKRHIFTYLTIASDCIITQCFHFLNPSTVLVPIKLQLASCNTLSR